jgi:hypothetical protein
VLHRLPIWPTALDRVHVTRNRSSGGKRRSIVHVHTAPLPDDQVTAIDRVPATSLVRTVLDLCRTLPIEQAVAAGDAALAYGLVRHVLEDQLTRMTRWPGIRQARRAVELLDPRSESAGESASRVRLHQDGLPAPDLQHDIFDEQGAFVARVDFLWKEQRTFGEFDGKIKYGRLLKPGQSIEEVLFEEKRREDALRIWVGRLCGGCGPICIGWVSFAIGCCGRLHDPPHEVDRVLPSAVRLRDLHSVRRSRGGVRAVFRRCWGPRPSIIEPTSSASSVFVAFLGFCLERRAIGQLSVLGPWWAMS